MDPNLRSALLGVVQGLTEFLPISSSGHLAIGAQLFGETETTLAFIVLLHVGTLVATAIVLRTEVGAMLDELGRCLGRPARFRETDEGRELAAVMIGTAITAVLALALQPVAESFTQNLLGVGVGLLVTAGVLLTTRRADGALTVPTTRIALLVGLAQGIAVLPGISRSGSTIAAALLLGMQPAAAFRFSFLLSIPIILLAVAHEIVFGDEPRAGFSTEALVGGLMAFTVGFLALVWLRRLVTRGRFWAFSLYLVPVGIAVILFSLGDVR